MVLLHVRILWVLTGSKQPIIYEPEQLSMPVLLIIGQTDRTVVAKANIKTRWHWHVPGNIRNWVKKPPPALKKVN
jgi:pimeloyl-ACP methyl ester carboxylesterase